MELTNTFSISRPVERAPVERAWEVITDLSAPDELAAGRGIRTILRPGGDAR